MDVRLPDGTIIRNVPEGTTRAQLTARLKRNGYDVSSLLDEEEERTFGGYAKEAFKGLIPGAVSGIETAIAGAASVLPEEAEQAVRRKVSEVAEPIRETFAPAPGYEDTVVRELSEAVGSTAPFIGAGLLGKLAATGLAAATGAGEARQRAEQEDVTEGERAAATALGVGPGLIEAVPPLRILRRFGFGKEAIEEVAGLAPSLRRIAAAGGEEALQEASTQVLQNLIAKGVYKPEEEVFGGVTEAAELGGGAGAIVGAIAELALGRRLRGTEPPPEEQEEGITEEPTPPVTPATGAEAARRARVAPSEQMELPLDTEAVQIPMFGEEEAAAPTPSLYRPAEDALSDLKPRSRAYKEEARSLGLKLDRKGNVKPNQFVFEQPEAREYKLIYTDADGNEVSELFGTLEAQQEAYDELVASGIPAKNIVKKLEEAPLTQGRFEFEVPQEQPDLPMYVPPTEGQMDMFGTPMPRGGEMPTVPTAAEMPVVEEVPEEQYALNLPGIPMERLTPRDRVLRAMAITEDKKNIPNLRFATELRPMELQKTLGDLKKENAIKFNKQANEWELTPEGAERVRTPRKKIGSARLGRRADVSVPPSGTPPPPTAETGESGVAGAGAPPSQSDVGEEAGQPPLDRMAMIRRAQEKRVAQEAVGQVADRRSTLRTQAIDAFDTDKINEAAYNEINTELKRPVPNFARVSSLLEGTAKPKREKEVGLKFQRADEFAPIRFAKVKTSKGTRFMEIERENPDGTITGRRVNPKDGSRWYDPTVEKEGIDREELIRVPKANVVQELRQSLYYGDLRPFTESKFQRSYNPQIETPQFKNWFGDSKAVDQEGKPLVLYRGAIGETKVPEGALEGKPREGYATFASTSPEVAASYGQPDFAFGQSGAITPLYVKANKLIEFPVRVTKDGFRRFDKFEFDQQAQRLRPGEVLVARQVVDYGPRASVETDPERLYSYPSDIYAWGQGTKVKSAVGNVGAFGPEESIVAQRGEVGAGIPVERVQATASEAIRGWTNPPNVVVASSVDDPVIPENYRKRIPADAPGFYVDGTTYVLADRAKDESGVRGTVFHESLGHYGLQQEFQDGLQDVMQGIYDTNPKMRAEADARIKKFGISAPTAVEEVFAERSEAGPIKEAWLRNAFNRVAAYIRNFLRQRGFVSKYSDNDVDQILRQAHRRVTQLKKVPYDPLSDRILYQRTPEEKLKADRALVNSVGSSQNRLPEPTARIKEGARTAASMIPRWLRRGVFSFESTHQLADMYRPYTDKLDELWDLQNRDGAALRLKTDKIHDNLKKWHKVMDKFPPAARERIYNLFLDTTVDQIEVLDSAADPVLRDNAAVKNMKVVMKPNTEHSLYKQFSQLPQPVRDLYRDLRLAYLEDANEMEQLLSQYITPSEWQKLQMEFNKKRLAVYLPLFRSGEYKLVYTDKDGETVSRQFETSEEREKAFREVRSSGIPESKIVRKMASEFAASDIPPAGFYGKVVAKLRENDVDEKTIAKLFDLYMDYMPATSVLQLRRKRKKTPGYESDVLRAYASVGGAYARRLVNMRFMPQINKAFEDLRADLGQGSFWVSYKDSKGRTVRNGYDTDELRRMAVRQAIEDGADRNSVKYFSLSDEEAADIEDIVQGQIDFFNNPKLDNYASKAAYFSFTMYMGGNVSSAIIDLTHIPMVVYSLLGSKYGFGRAAASMQRAHRYYMNPKKKLPAEIAELPSVMKRATEDGILGEQRIMDLAEFNNRFGDFGSKALEVKARVDRAMGSIFAMSDRYNRGLTFISAYELAKNQLQKKGLKGDELLEAAYTDAKRAVYDSYGSSFPKAGPSIMQNGLARLALTFKRFALNRMWLLFKALDQATRGESKEVKNMARAQLLGFYGMAYIFSGAQGLPFVGAFQLLASLFNGMFGDDDELYDVQDAMRQAVGMFNYRGPINYVLGVDIASRSGWDQMLWRDDPRRIAEVGPATYAMEQLLGPAFSYAVNAPRAFEHFSEGRFSQGMETLTPRVIANIFKAFRYGTEGALTKDNIPVVDDISKRNQFMQLLGFAPTKVGEAYQQAGVAKKFEREINDRRDGLIRRAMMAIVSEDDEGRADALKEIMKFNEKHPGKPITDESISRSVTNHYIKLNQSVNGVRVDPKLAQEIYDRLGYDTEDTLDESTLEEQEDLATDLLYE